MNSKLTKNIHSEFDTILYISVLEHIEKDTEDLEINLTKLKKNGHIIIVFLLIIICTVNLIEKLVTIEDIKLIILKA